MSTTSPSAPYYSLCVDGGGSKCTAVLISSDGTTLTGEEGPCNPSTIGLEATVQVIQSAIYLALAQDTLPQHFSGIASLNIASAWIGVAGYDRPTLAPAINEAIEKLLGLTLGPRLRITADIDLLAVNAAQWNAESAIVLVAGTGSVAMSYGKAKGSKDDDTLVRTGRVGGWGPLLGDDGSGFAIGREALRVALRTSDTLQSTEGDYMTDDVEMPTLSRTVLDYFRQERQQDGGADFHPHDLLSSILTSTTTSTTSTSPSPTKTIAHAARLVLDLAEKDGQARLILHKGAASLADLVVELATIKKLDPSKTALIMAGGLLNHTLYNRMVRHKLEEIKLDFRWTTQVQSPALEGAMYLAGRRIGV
ncbi:hypothetical protein Sste5346_004842 [Sporothrix stenoceras]|uniref:N-acetyl-D-glucosamine kinase n=1 Tax=Sporothrix stenoceras TaxID=5173 RepID=A0ABR3Z7C3_9PEZI